KLYAAEWVSAFFLLLILISSVTVTAAGESRFQVEFANLTIYRDGLVHLTQMLVVNETFPAITLPLLSSSIENIIVLDENQTVLDYEINESNLTVFTLGAKSVLLEYDTISLTMKEAEVWTLIVENPYNLTVFLPENSTIVFMSEMPTAIDTEGSKITLSLFPGSWEISYVLPLFPQDDSTDEDESPIKILVEYLIAASAAVAAVFLSALILFRRRRGPNVGKILEAHPQLKQEDKDVIKFLAEKGGKAFEAEVRERFPDMPRTSLWRLVRRLERLEIVEVKKIGLENQVELKK
ncbi:MAG: hypothetical protein NWE97_02730, partial [Candidatus Bathyarchaeota archaeon]|nr:hypothetical protein [Candidatus Bathyarchaeota archaeon]